MNVPQQSRRSEVVKKLQPVALAQSGRCETATHISWVGEEQTLPNAVMGRRNRVAHNGSSSIPLAVGIGLRAPHYQDLLDTLPKLGWLEVHSENYFGQGGTPLAYLGALREHYPLSLHGVGLSLGSVDALNLEHLRKLRALANRFEPDLISEHLSWGSVDGRHFHDLLPLPYTEESLAHLVQRVAQAQEVLGRQLLLENPSSYLHYQHSTVPEAEFMAEITRHTGCGILLDVNNVYVSACNHGFNPRDYLKAVPSAAVGEVHLAGFAVNRFNNGEILIDTHSRPVDPAVWMLYAEALSRLGPVPTLVEWDADIPPLAVLLNEADKAETYLAEARRVLAA